MRKILTLLFLFWSVQISILDRTPFVFAAEEPAEESSDETAEEGEKEQSIYARQGSLLEEKPQGRHQPWKLLRAIQRLQDNMVTGDRNAARAYRILLVHSANWMRKLDDNAWQYERNLDAVAAYLLIGGDVEIGYKALMKSRLDKPHKLLLESAVAYSERDVTRAYAIMSQIDHMSLPASMAGQVALAKGMVFSSADLERAISYLQQARLLAPGTLIEEAALRRSIRIAAELGRMKDLRHFTRTYLHRFPKSHYFNDYLRNASYGLVKLAGSDGSDVIADFRRLIKTINLEQQINVTQYVARKAVLTGRYRLADWAAEQAFARVEENSKFHTRLKLYSAAGKVMDPEQTEVTAKLIGELNSNHLENFDKRIFEAVKILSEQILRHPLDEPMKAKDDGYPLMKKPEKKMDKMASLQSKRLKKLSTKMKEILNRSVQ
ncbi:MAG: hypothetical protein AAF478_09645 [Pseudomonadota bacterium]